MIQLDKAYFLKACHPEKNVAGDEQTVALKGQHFEKLRINFKKAGDGFHSDPLCDDGCTLCLYLRNGPAPEKYLCHTP